MTGPALDRRDGTTIRVERVEVGGVEEFDTNSFYYRWCYSLGIFIKKCK